jgi:hypothetical protein
MWESQRDFQRNVGRVESRLLGFPCFPYSVISIPCFGMRVQRAKLPKINRFPGTCFNCERIAERLRQSSMTPTRLVLKAAYLCVAGFAFSICTVLHGQTITGTWQGTLSAKETQRIVLKFAKADSNGSLRGSLTFIDRGPSGIPLLSVTFAPPDLSVAVADYRLIHRYPVCRDTPNSRQSSETDISSFWWLDKNCRR